MCRYSLYQNPINDSVVKKTTKKARLAVPQ